jgi:hypothetical protein
MIGARTLAIGLCVLAVAHPLAAQTPAAKAPDEDAILATVDRFMLTIARNDFAAMSALVLEGSFSVMERPGADGRPQTMRRVFDASTRKPGNFREAYWDPVVQQRGGIAVVWAPYEFWSDGKTTHCGVDVVDLVKQQDGWKIANLMWTVEPDACPSMRPADPSRVRPRVQ